MKKEYAGDFCSDTQTATESLLDESVDIEEEFSAELGIDFCPLEAGVEDTAAHQHSRTAMPYLIWFQTSTAIQIIIHLIIPSLTFSKTENLILKA